MVSSSTNPTNMEGNSPGVSLLLVMSVATNLSSDYDDLMPYL